MNQITSAVTCGGRVFTVLCRKLHWMLKATLSHTHTYERRKEGRNVLFNDALNTFYLRLYGVTHMVKDHSDSCCHIGYSFRLAARVLYASSHRQDNTYHSLCYTSRGALAGTRNSSMGPPHGLRQIETHTHTHTHSKVLIMNCKGLASLVRYNSSSLYTHVEVCNSITKHDIRDKT